METLLNLCIYGTIACSAFIFLSCLRIGTKSILFGVHCWFIHPLFVALGWWKLYGFPYDPRLWVAFFVHDLGYWGKPNMDGTEGEQHPHFGAKIMKWLFDYKFRGSPAPGYQEWVCSPWFCFTLYHSRFMAKRHKMNPSRLCFADKMAFVITPRWFYLIQANLSGEIHEYMCGQGCRTPALERGQWQWLTECQNYVRKWIAEHKDGREDKWTGTVMDHAREQETIC